MIMMQIVGDDKYYLKKTNYRIEIRSDESSTWLTYASTYQAYVTKPTADPSESSMSYRDSLADAYIELVKSSNSSHFEEDARE